MHWREALELLGGTARYTDLARLDVSRHTLRRALDAGLVVRPHRGTYCLPGKSRSEQLAKLFRAQSTCVTRCGEFGLPLLDEPRSTHLWVPRDRSISRASGRPVSEVLLHRRDDVDADYAHSVVGAIDVSGLCLPLREQLALVDAAARAGWIDPARVAGLIVSGTQRVASLLQYMDHRAESLTETFARLDLVRAGLYVEPQKSLIPGTRTDLVVEGTIALEVDSEKHHYFREAERRDRSRDRQLTIRGFIPMRITFEDAVRSMDEVVSDIRAALWRHGAEPRRLT